MVPIKPSNPQNRHYHSMQGSFAPSTCHFRILHAIGTQTHVQGLPHLEVHSFGSVIESPTSVKTCGRTHDLKIGQ